MTNLVFFGTGPVASASLDFLADHFTIEAVITKTKAPKHKGDAPVEDLCMARHLPVFFVNNQHDLTKLIDDQNFISKVGIVVDFGIIISQQVIDSFDMGIVNSHFSLLPEWRGADPITFSVLSGQPKTGVSLMVIDAGLDTGKLITRRVLAIEPKDTTESLTKRLVDFSNQLLFEYLPGYIKGEIVPTAQPHPDRATYSRKLTKSDAMIDWDDDASAIECKIRAFWPWPKARAIIGSMECIIVNADVVRQDEQKPAGTITIDTSQKNKATLVISCGHDALSITTLQPLGKKEMPVQAFLAGYKSQIQS